MRISDPTRSACRHAMAADILRAHGQIRIAAYGLSMLPSLWPGDVLTVKQESLDDIAEGEIVLCERNGQFVAHRVLRRPSAGDPYLVTRGDALPFEDEPVARYKVLGRVVSVERRGRPLPSVPTCSTRTRVFGQLLSSWGRVRSLALRWQSVRCGSPAVGEI